MSSYQVTSSAPPNQPYPAYPATAAPPYPIQFSPNPSPSIPGVIPYFLQQQQAQKPEPPAPPPIVPAVTPGVASQALKKSISYQLKASGFNTAESQAMQRLEYEVIAFVGQLFHRAHEYANLANRAGPIATDLMLACEDHGLRSKELRRMRTKQGRKQTRAFSQREDFKGVALVPPRSPSPSPERLPSDDEEPPIPVTLRTLPPYFPTLPPKHTYLRTPVSPPKKAALPSLEKKLETAGLVQESLRSLMLATEDSSGQEDAELLGHIVNWEAGLHPRKRWKVGTR